MIPARPGRALAVSVVVIDLAVALIGQIVRVHKAGRASLVPFAREVATRVSPSTALAADAELDESDFLVLAYRLARPIPRLTKEHPCVPDVYRLATPRPGAPLVAPLVISDRRGVPVVLVHDSPTTCPLALEHESDR